MQAPCTNHKAIWMTKSGTGSRRATACPCATTTAVAFRVAAREANTIRHIVPLTQLLLLTSSARWRIQLDSSDRHAPAPSACARSLTLAHRTCSRSSSTTPCFMARPVGGHVRELAYNWQASGFVTGDLSLRAPHLFDTFDIADIAYAKAPSPWCGSSPHRVGCWD